MHWGIQAVLHTLYPPSCVSCGELVESEFGLCGHCWRDMPFISGPVCDSCGVPLPGPVDGHRLECDACMQTPRSWRMGRAAMLYSGTGRKMVLGLKHGDRQDIARPAGQWLAQAAKPLIQPDMVIAPVPLHRFRLLRRRYNQSALLSRAVATRLNLTHCPDLLVRTRQTPSLDRRTREERTEILSGAIAVHPGRTGQIKDRPVLIVDDVMTSGATLEACSTACLVGGASDVFVLVLARVANDP
ncbi:MAG: double zinc ribbon domain-containing protein [Paracoccaceae bacterium]